MTPFAEHVGKELFLAALPGHEKLQRHAWLGTICSFRRLRALFARGLFYQPVAHLLSSLSNSPTRVYHGRVMGESCIPTFHGLIISLTNIQKNFCVSPKLQLS
jgi:hypothetical protein